ncbi:MAG TPA: hypothetical protein PL017_11385 [Tenuifilaceae bacterium]|nr:hypothetical protein [Tenuifilaceae bacterium]HPE19322.1 hypothetical protein [Tenuifilaceae bacterium]HPJ46693.1 hypothetical protein [Tenuifilaceae bacterium]HPQ35144.1 hypothetical protein [Tenuifilaceae bacterium]HRX69089.1 hypothetical protein [Tenuifilaceae bacterium]
MKTNRISKVALVCFLSMLLAGNNTFGQNREPQNIYRVAVKSRYVLEDGQRTKDYFAIKQLISDSLGRMHTEIDFDWETHYPKNYRWHYFNGQTKYRTDFFVNEKLSKVENYKWDTQGKLTELTIEKVFPTDTSIVLKETYAYNPDGTIKNITGYNEKGKKGFKTKHKYDDKGTEILRKVKGKKAVPSDSIMFLSRVPEYDSVGRVVKETKEVEKFSRGKSTSTFAYTYDENGNKVQQLEMDAAGNLTKKIEFIYRKDNKIQQIKEFDASDKLIDWQAWRYEIYKTNDRRQRVLE